MSATLLLKGIPDHNMRLQIALRENGKHDLSLLCALGHILYL